MNKHLPGGPKRAGVVSFLNLYVCSARNRNDLLQQIAVDPSHTLYETAYWQKTTAFPISCEIFYQKGPKNAC